MLVSFFARAIAMLRAAEEPSPRPTGIVLLILISVRLLIPQASDINDIISFRSCIIFVSLSSTSTVICGKGIVIPL